MLFHEIFHLLPISLNIYLMKNVCTLNKIIKRTDECNKYIYIEE